jgi:hypothetical protein
MDLPPLSPGSRVMEGPGERRSCHLWTFSESHGGCCRSHHQKIEGPRVAGYSLEGVEGTVSLLRLRPSRCASFSVGPRSSCAHPEPRRSLIGKDESRDWCCDDWSFATHCGKEEWEKPCCREVKGEACRRDGLACCRTTNSDSCMERCCGGRR